MSVIPQNANQKQSWSRVACIESIFSRGSDDGKVRSGDAVCYVRPNFVEIKTIPDPDGPMPNYGTGAKRGAVCSFSRKSRSRLIKLMASLAEYPQVWHDFTFADDVMAGKTETERAQYSSNALKQFKRDLEKRYPKISGVWRREWEARKSGRLRGEVCPHFHMLFHMPGVGRKHYLAMCLRLARMWVDATCTRDERAIKVAQNPKSYRWLNGVKMAQIYVSKYVSKIELNDTGQSRGRYWGKIGDLPICPPICVPLTWRAEYKLRRIFSKIALSREKKMLGEGKRVHYRLSKVFKRIGSEGNCWLLMGVKEALRALSFVEDVNLMHFVT